MIALHVDAFKLLGVGVGVAGGGGFGGGGVGWGVGVYWVGLGFGSVVASQSVLAVWQCRQGRIEKLQTCRWKCTIR